MATAEDIKRLDDRIDKERTEFNIEIQGIRAACADRHSIISENVTEIKVTLARIEERQITAYGQLNEGDSIFSRHDERLREIEDQLSNWKGYFRGMAVIATAVSTVLAIILPMVIKAALSAFMKL